jgi:hypothetical protein
MSSAMFPREAGAVGLLLRDLLVDRLSQLLAKHCTFKMTSVVNLPFDLRYFYVLCAGVC